MTWVIVLAVVFVNGLLVLVASPDMATYTSQRDRFFVFAAVGTVLYFVLAYWELRRRKAFAGRVAVETAATTHGSHAA